MINYIIREYINSYEITSGEVNSFDCFIGHTLQIVLATPNRWLGGNIQDIKRHLIYFVSENQI